MVRVFIDIETLPTESNAAIDFSVKKIKPPSNYKKPEAIDKYINAARDEVIAKTALSGLFGTVYMIGYAINDGPVDVIYGESEAHTLAMFDDVLRARGLRNEYSDSKATFVGHNALDFDLPFLSQRLMIHGRSPLFRHGVKYPPVFDTMKAFACGRYKQYYGLEALCLAFGLLSSKGDLDGSKIYDYFKAGRHDEVIDYCKGDVEDVRSLYLAMNQIKVTDLAA